jgi:uncharacterized protein (DUF433 family)
MFMTVLEEKALSKPVPLTDGADGVIRVAGTRVTLDTVVAAFEEGATAEEIAQQYPTLLLADVYAVLGFYLRQRKSVDAYLLQRQRKGATVREENEKRFPPDAIRNRLLARRKARS